MVDTSEKGVVRVESLAKHYGPKVAVMDVSLQLKAGEIVGLLGPNGAGKTTTFYMVVGLVPSTSGRVFLDGRDITAMPMWQRARAGRRYRRRRTPRSPRPSHKRGPCSGRLPCRCGF